ncbi:unnamed protein product [Phaedon cochleariae]|uniref:Uncharacterized protein n=1 Tax=Phaedon cochleariae TaxID=80249 RepID=A0A9P0GQ31_PHACE|nr:unnamed protein product [Phaedon cochleariae]
MVVPIERVSRAEKPKKYIGNNLNVSLISNRTGLHITGNNCNVKISENSAPIKIIGDNCQLTVLNGRGSIEYIGNCGKINLGPQVSEDVLSYIGNEGEISTVSFAEDFKKCDARESNPSPKNNREGSRVKCGNMAESKARISVCNSNVIRITTSCIPDSINICIPSIRIGGKRHCHSHISHKH